MSTLERIANNFWSLGISRDVATFLALKGYSPKVADGDFSHLSLRGLDHPILFRPRTSDIPVVWELFHTREYEFVDGWPFKTVVDCGANVGMFLAWLLRNSHGAIERYVGVEPDVQSFGVLAKQVNSLGVAGIATLLQGAAWPHDGEVTFDDRGQSWGHRVAEDGTGKVRAMTVDTILDRAELASCDLLKLDIEGGERQVLSSLASWAHRVDALVVELHDGLDYEWFASTVGPAGFDCAPPGKLFNQHPGAVRRGSPMERFAHAS